MGLTKFQSRLSMEARGRSATGAEPFKVHTRTILHSDLTDADTQQDIDISVGDDGVTFPANAYVICASTDTVTAFAGTTTLTVDVGDAGDRDELIDGADIKAAGFDRTVIGVYTPWTLEAAAYVPLARFDSTGANLVALTQGAVKIRIYYFCPERPDTN